MTTSGTTSENEWQWMTTNYNTGNEWRWMTAIGATNENEWKQEKIAILSFKMKYSGSWRIYSIFYAVYDYYIQQYI